MATAPQHRTPEGFVLTEVQQDLWGRVTMYQVDGTRYFLTRTPTGWRAQIAPHGKARRRYVGPGWEGPLQCVRYLSRYGYLRPESP